MNKKSISKSVMKLVLTLYSLQLISCTTIQNTDYIKNNIFYSLFNDSRVPNFIDTDLANYFTERGRYSFVKQNTFTKNNDGYTLTVQYFPSLNNEVHLFNIKIVNTDLEKNTPPGYLDMEDFIGRRGIWEMLNASGFLLCGSFSFMDYSTHYYQNKNWLLLLGLRKDTMEIFIEKKNPNGSKLTQLLSEE